MHLQVTVLTALCALTFCVSAVKHNKNDEVRYLTCEEEVHSRYLDGKFVGDVPQYNGFDVLQNSGGSPGHLKEFTRADGSSSERRLSYSYANTDWKTWIRLEKAQVQNIGTRKQTTVNGKIYWKPRNFCGWFRRAKYSINKNSTFKFEVEYGTKCTLEVDKNGFANDKSVLSCIPVAHCTSGGECVAGTSIELLASLVGGSG